MWDLFDVQVRCLEIVMRCQQGHFSFHEHNFQCPGINSFFDLLMITRGHERLRGRSSVWKWSLSVSPLDVMSCGFVKLGGWPAGIVDVLWKPGTCLSSKLLPDAMMGPTGSCRWECIDTYILSLYIYIYLNSVLLWPTLSTTGEAPCSYTARNKYLQKQGNSSTPLKLMICRY